MVRLEFYCFEIFDLKKKKYIIVEVYLNNCERIENENEISV